MNQAMETPLQSILAQLVRQEIMTEEEAGAVYSCVEVGHEDCPEEVAEVLNRLMGPRAIAPLPTYQGILENALSMMEALEDLEPTSALKQAASDSGIQYGPDMKRFVTWAQAQIKQL